MNIPIDTRINRYILGSSPRTLLLKQALSAAAQGDAHVLLLGQGGFDKKALAAALMRASDRSRSFVVVDPKDVSALKRHQSLKAGGVAYLESADNLVAEEIAHWFQDLKASGVRLVADAAKNNDVVTRLSQQLEGSLLVIEVPPLSEIREDIPLIIEGIFEEFLEQDPSCDIPHFSAQALKHLMAHTWRGNLSELREVLRRATRDYPGKLLDETNVRALLNPGGGAARLAPSLMRGEGVNILPDPAAFRNTLTAESQIGLKDYLSEIERVLIEEALDAHNQNVSRAARTLGLQRTTLIEKMKKLDLR